MQAMFPRSLFAVLFVLLAGQLAWAGEQEPAAQPQQWWLATFSETGHERLRSMLHAKPRFQELRTATKPPDPPVRELLALEAVERGRAPLLFVTYDGLFVCGSHGCPLELFRRDARGNWRSVLDVITYADRVGIGPGEAHGFKDLVFLGQPISNGFCPVWRYNGERYNYQSLMAPDDEPCRSLNLKDEQEQSKLGRMR